mmetsp:Transcript_2658/g.8578  ORF Transcript_2658/g.8578 Transcript_2658/m.8578 type:complete len:230 (+) Transcript_2658:1129-1818(+)
MVDVVTCVPRGRWLLVVLPLPPSSSSLAKSILSDTDPLVHRWVPPHPRAAGSFFLLQVLLSRGSRGGAWQLRPEVLLRGRLGSVPSCRGHRGFDALTLLAAGLSLSPPPTQGALPSSRSVGLKPPRCGRQERAWSVVLGRLLRSSGSELVCNIAPLKLLEGVCSQCTGSSLGLKLLESASLEHARSIISFTLVNCASLGGMPNFACLELPNGVIPMSGWMIVCLKFLKR